MLTKEEFCTRFKTEMIRIAVPEAGDESAVGQYADEIAPTYFEEDDQREEGPEACAQADISYWE